MLRISICTEVWNGKFVFNQSSAAAVQLFILWSWKKIIFLFGVSLTQIHNQLAFWKTAGKLMENCREAWCWYWQCHNFCIMVCHSFRKVEWIAHTIWKEEKETNQLFRKVDQMAMQWFDHDSWVYSTYETLKGYILASDRTWASYSRNKWSETTPTIVAQ